MVSSSLAHRSMLSNPFLLESSQFDIPYIGLLPFSSASAPTHNQTPGAPKAMTKVTSKGQGGRQCPTSSMCPPDFDGNVSPALNSLR